MLDLMLAQAPLPKALESQHETLVIYEVSPAMAKGNLEKIKGITANRV